MRAIFLRAMRVSGVSRRALPSTDSDRGVQIAGVTTIGAFFETAGRHPGRLAWKHGRHEWTWEEAARDVRRVARALIALGVAPGGSVAIVGPNRPEWVSGDLGAIAAGAIPTPIYPTLTGEQARIVPELPPQASDPDFLAYVGREIEAINAQLTSFHSIKRFPGLAGSFSVESGELTPTLKLTRTLRSESYAPPTTEVFAH